MTLLPLGTPGRAFHIKLALQTASPTLVQFEATGLFFHTTYALVIPVKPIDVARAVVYETGVKCGLEMNIPITRTLFRLTKPAAGRTIVVYSLNHQRRDHAMKKALLFVCLVAMIVVVSPEPARSFNPAAHLYIAEHLVPNAPDKTNLFYGSIAPDLSQYTDPAKWKSDPFLDTHYTYADLTHDAVGVAQRAFAAGWFTHNEYNGADFYAHIGGPLGNGYVTLRAGALASEIPGLTPEFAHFAIETAIDLLLKEDHDHSLGTKLLTAALLRSPLDRELLTKVLVVKNGETDWITLVTAELAFRNAVTQYASALALPRPFDKAAIIRLGVQLAQQEFNITTTVDEVRAVLNAALNLCRAVPYYEYAISPAIENITLP